MANREAAHEPAPPRHQADTSFLQLQRRLIAAAFHIQPKLTITPADDPSEREADAVARAVVDGMAAPRAQSRPATSGGLVQALRRRFAGETEATYQKRLGKYRTCAARGEAAWTELHRHLNAGITVNYIAGHSSEYLERYETFIANDDEGYTVTTQVRGTNVQPYINTFSRDLTRMVSSTLNNRRVDEDTVGKGRALFNNEVIWNQHRVLLAALRAAGDRDPMPAEGDLTSYKRTDVSYDETYQVVSLLHDEATDGKVRQFRPEDTKQDSDFYAVIGTPNVYPGLLLAAHQPARRNTVSMVETKPAPFKRDEQARLTGDISSVEYMQVFYKDVDGSEKGERKPHGLVPAFWSPFAARHKESLVDPWRPPEPGSDWWIEPDIPPPPPVSDLKKSAPPPKKKEEEAVPPPPPEPAEQIGAEVRGPVEDDKVSRKPWSSQATGQPAFEDMASAIDAARPNGKPLHAEVRATMEGAIGADFGGVRVHTGAQADALNRAIDARAFTTGSDIFFRHGEYRPAARDGQELLAHELAHVIQQGAARQEREPRPVQTKLTVTPAGGVAVQALRGPLKDEFDYVDRWETYDDCRKRGEKLWSELKAVLGTEAKGARDGVVATRDKYEQRYQTAIDNHHAGYEVKTYLRGSRGRATYVNVFSKDLSRLVEAVSNYREDDATEAERKQQAEKKKSETESDDAGAPRLPLYYRRHLKRQADHHRQPGTGALFNNEIIWNQHRRLLDAWKEQQSDTPVPAAGTLESITRSSVVNRETCDVVSLIHDEKEADSRKTLRPPAAESTAADDDFFALIGTPNVRPGVLLLRHQPSLRKTIDRIETLPGSYDEEDKGRLVNVHSIKTFFKAAGSETVTATESKARGKIDERFRTPR